MTENHTSPNASPLAAWLGPLGLSCGLALGISALLVIAARLTGMIDATLPFGFAWTMLLASAALAALARACHLPGNHPDLPRSIRWALAVVPALSLVLLARAVTFAPLTEFSTFLLWLTVLAEEAISLTLFTQHPVGSAVRTKFQPAQTNLPTEHPELNLTPEPPSPRLPEEEPLSPETTQQWTRTLIDGEDAYHGLLRLSLTPGQRHAHLHVAFCPPFAQVPEAELLQLEGPEATLNPGQIQCHGARFDIKLRQATASETECLFELAASAPAAQQEGTQRQAG